VRRSAGARARVVAVRARPAAPRRARVRRTPAAVAAAAALPEHAVSTKSGAAHVVECAPDGTCLLYIDLPPGARGDVAAGVRGPAHGGARARRPDMTLATADHNVPTSDRSGFVDVASFIKEVESRTQARRRRVARSTARAFGRARP
jgi:homoaconitase/3-isopropylmalate dehydratase large subunit